MYYIKYKYTQKNNCFDVGDVSCYSILLTHIIIPGEEKKLLLNPGSLLDLRTTTDDDGPSHVKALPTLFHSYSHQIMTRV